MGAPMATKMTEWPGGLTVYDIRTEAMTPLAEKGASLADSVADVAAADIIHITVLDDAQVREVVGELATARQARNGHRDPFDHQRHDGGRTRRANSNRRASISSTRRSAAARPRRRRASSPPWWAPTREVYERIKPAFKHWAAVVIHAGEPGAGTRMKLARNMLTFTSYAAACEAMKLAEAAGLDLQALGQGGASHRRTHQRPGRDHGSAKT